MIRSCGLRRVTVAGASLLSFVLLPVVSLNAQRPAERALLDQFRDSLAQTSDVEAIAALEERLIEVAKRNRDDPLVHLRLGFVALRKGEILGLSHSRKGTPFDDAAGEFEWAAELAPDWPYPWYGLGIAELGMSYLPPTGVENVRQHLGKDHQSKAADAFARATEADPSYIPALTALTEVALAQKIKPKRELALAAARRASRAAPRRPEVHLARARLEREVGSSDSSLVALQAYVAAAGDAAVARFESAQALYDLGRASDGRDAYFNGAGHIITTDSRRLFRSDIEWIADSAELRSYDLEAVGALRAWLTHFWTRRDLAAGRRPGERLAEHRRRQNHALRNFRRIGSLEFLPALYDPPISTILRPGEVTGQGIVDLALREGVNPATAGACGSKLVDARGVIYVRHGEPDDIASYGGVEARPNVSWKYERPGKPLLFHFMQPIGASDYCLYVLPDLIPDVLASRAGLSSTFQNLGSRASIDRAVSQGWRNMVEGLTTDSYMLQFGRDLDPVVRAYALSDPNSRGSRLLLVYVIPGDRLEPVSEGAPIAYRVNVRALVGTARDSLIAFSDSVRSFGYRRALERGQFLAGAEEFPLPVGRYNLRLVLAQPEHEAGGSVELSTINLPDFRQPRLSMSNLVLGREGLGLMIFNGRDSIPVDPLNTYPAGSRVEVYYEVAGVPGGTSYTTDIQLVAIEDGDDEAALEGRAPDITLSFSEAAEAPFARVRRQVDLGALRPGQYRLRVRVTDLASGTSRRQDATIAVVD